jgi:predicted RNase H-like HicB family nuclease
MIIEYIEAALSRAKYEIIDDEEPYFGEVPGLKGVWATGKTLEQCRDNLREVIDGWIIVRLRKNLPIPSIGGCTIEELSRSEAGASV